MWVFCAFTPFISAFVVFPRKYVDLLNLISKYVTSASNFFLKKGIVDLAGKANI